MIALAQTENLCPLFSDHCPARTWPFRLHWHVQAPRPRASSKLLFERGKNIRVTRLAREKPE
jgi:hypothetical protein